MLTTYRKTGPARVFLSERDAIAAIKGGKIQEGDIMVLMCRGPLGSGMEASITSALKHLSFGKHVALITDARFSGVSTGACIGHVSPEALAGGPIGKLQDGDTIQIVIDRNKLEGTVCNLVGPDGTPASGDALLTARPLRADLHADPNRPTTRASGPLSRDVSGGAWGGTVYDVDAILRVLAAGKRALAAEEDGQP